MIFESHAHYDDRKFDEDREALIECLPENDIKYVVNIGSDIESTRASLLLAEKYPFFYAAAGVHPSDVQQLNEETFAWLKKQAGHEKCVAVGEIGLDYYWDKDPIVRENQKNWFCRQLDLARELKLPVVVHSRDAAKDTLDIVKVMNAKETGGVIHCFSYSVEIAREYLNMGFYIGIGGVVTFDNAKALKEVTRYAPLDRILLETDCPYLAPVPNRGKRNSSLNLKYIAQAIAQIKGLTYDQVIQATSANAIRMYDLGRRISGNPPSQIENDLSQNEQR